MKVHIYSRKEIQELLLTDVLKNVAVISFYDPKAKCTNKEYKSVDYSGKTDRVFEIPLYDIDLSEFEEFGLTYDTFFPEVDRVAEFIYQAKEEGLDIICQCEYGESRSSGCAAAILEHFYKKGILVFADYRYYPNRVVYHKVYEALENLKKE